MAVPVSVPHGVTVIFLILYVAHHAQCGQVLVGRVRQVDTAIGKSLFQLVRRGINGTIVIIQALCRNPLHLEVTFEHHSRGYGIDLCFCSGKRILGAIEQTLVTVSAIICK